VARGRPGPVASAPDVQALGTLTDTFSGEVVLADDPGYDSARVVWNGMIDRRPALIVRCGTVGDVVEALAFARDSGILLAVRGGGHGVAGNAVCDGGLVIDLATMTGVEVDPQRRVGDATSVEAEDLERLRGLGLSELEIMDVVLAAAARCFFSKTLDALGVQPDAVYRELEPELREALTVGRPIAGEHTPTAQE
jgi:hypothetical protein